jgi:ComF family protein
MRALGNRKVVTCLRANEATARALGRLGEMNPLHTLLGSVLEVLAPDSCAACTGALERRRELFCSSCTAEVRLGLRTRAVGAVPAWAVAEYRGPVQTAIKRFKFSGHPELARRFGAALAQALLTSSALAERDDHALVRQVLSGACLVPVPLHPLRLAERGYNQAALFAKAIARQLGAVTELRALERSHSTQQQSRLNREQRLENLRGHLRVRRMPHGRVVLVDDVLTTGATLRSCAEALESSGVTVAGMLTIAHTD